MVNYVLIVGLVVTIELSDEQAIAGRLHHDDKHCIHIAATFPRLLAPSARLDTCPMLSSQADHKAARKYCDVSLFLGICDLGTDEVE